jgi:hypothetical protein
MTRQDRIVRSHKLSAARDAIDTYGTRTNRDHSNAWQARGRFADVLTLGARVLASVPQSAYALTA